MIITTLLHNCHVCTHVIPSLILKQNKISSQCCLYDSKSRSFSSPPTYSHHPKLSKL